MLMTEDFEIIPGSTHSYDRGSWNHTRQEGVEEGPLCPQVSCIILPSRVYQGWKAQKPNCCRDGCTPPAKSQLLLRGWWTPLNRFSNKVQQMVLGIQLLLRGWWTPLNQFSNKVQCMMDGIRAAAAGGVDPPLANLQPLLPRRRGCTPLCSHLGT
jgi:hypothetical protein